MYSYTCLYIDSRISFLPIYLPARSAQRTAAIKYIALISVIINHKFGIGKYSYLEKFYDDKLINDTVIESSVS